MADFRKPLNNPIPFVVSLEPDTNPNPFVVSLSNHERNPRLADRILTLIEFDRTCLGSLHDPRAPVESRGTKSRHPS